MFRANDGHRQQGLFESTSLMDPRIVEKLKKSWAHIFYEHVFCNINEGLFADLYSDMGRPNFPINVLLSLEYIKHMKCCNDLELLDAFNFDFLVNYAVGIRTLGEVNLAERTIYNFRERVYKHCLENPGQDGILFGQFVELLHVFADKIGLSMSEQRTDTTLFMSNIKKSGRLSLAYDVLVKAVKAIPEGMRAEALAKALEPDFKTDMLYRAKAQEADSRLAILLGLCGDALKALEALPGAKQSSEARVLNRFLDEQSVMGPGGGGRLPKQGKEIPSGSLQSAHDEDATYRKKGNVGQSGYVLEISETCGKENAVQLITDYAVKPNNVSDVSMLAGRLGAIRKNTGCADVYVDGGFHSEDVHEAAAKNNIEIHLTDMTGKKPAKLPVAEFDIDAGTDLILKCPGGHKPIRAGLSKGQTSAHFAHEACANCGLFDKCYSQKQAKSNVVRINLKTVNASREREIIKASRKENTSRRAGIEGTNSALKRKGQGKLGVRGIIRNTFVSGCKVAAQNISRFIKYMRGGYKPKPQKPPLDGVLAPI